MSAGEIIGGLLLVVLAGGLNGSWNVAFSDRFGLAVPVTKEEVDVDYHLAWALFQWYAAVINIPICLYWAGGPRRVTWLVTSQASTFELVAIVAFSGLWGLGSVGFGWACRIAGIGLGTNLTMGVIMILGTLLPLLMDDDNEDDLADDDKRNRIILSKSLIGTGLLVCTVGLFFSMKSLSTRDSDEQQSKETTKSTRITEVAAGTTDVQEDAPVTAAEKTDPKDPVTTTSPDTMQSAEVSPSTVFKVGVCVFAGIFAAMLQFAFVFGNTLVDQAGANEDGPGETPASGAAAIIWLFAISISAPVSIVYGIYSSPIPISTLWRCPLKRHLLVLLTTSIPWVGHIHCYGYSSQLLNPSVSWPILMMTTVATGMVWSIVLGEWKEASTKSRRQLYVGLTVVLLGVVILMTSVIPNE